MNESKLLMPLLFIGHGSPENILNENSWTQSLKALTNKIPKPDAIVIISAHWLIPSLKITANPSPELIYDFFGFPQPLYSINYPCEGSLEVANKIASLLDGFQPTLDIKRGFDHGVWTALYHLYPDAKIPVVQISLSSELQYQQYLEIGQRLASLREQKILIIGSGNIVHNLRQLQGITTKPFKWASAFDNWVANTITNRNYENLTKPDEHIKSDFETAQPTPDHYLPLLICCGAARDTDKISFPFEGFQYGSISMRNVLWE